MLEVELVNPLVLDFSGQISWHAVASHGRCNFDCMQMCNTQDCSDGDVGGDGF